MSDIITVGLDLAKNVFQLDERRGAEQCRSARPLGSGQAGRAARGDLPPGSSLAVM